MKKTVHVRPHLQLKLKDIPIFHLCLCPLWCHITCFVLLSKLLYSQWRTPLSYAQRIQRSWIQRASPAETIHDKISKCFKNIIFCYYYYHYYMLSFILKLQNDSLALRLQPFYCFLAASCGLFWVCVYSHACFITVLKEFKCYNNIIFHIVYIKMTKYCDRKAKKKLFDMK